MWIGLYQDFTDPDFNEPDGGWKWITFLNNTCPSTTVIEVTLPDLDDSTFELIPTCDGATANIVGLTGGTFSFDQAPTRRSNH